MTDQSNPPTPPKKAPDGNSLLERATKAFDIGGLTPAPVPADIVAPATVRAPSRAVVRDSAAAVATGEAFPDQPPLIQPTRDDAAEPQVAHVDHSAPVGPLDPEPLHTRAIAFAGEQQRIDRTHLREQGMILPEGAVTGLLEEFRIVKRQVLETVRASLARNKGSRGQRVLICSPHPGEGKTFCAVNLALSVAAEKDSEVLLVDADFAKPSVLSTLGLQGGPGLMDALADSSLAIEDCVLTTDVPGLYVLPAGSQANHDSEYLASSRTGELLDRLTQGAPNRIVIFDSPPALAASPAAELAKHVGQAVLVARADETGQNALEDACHLLSACPDIRLLLNAARFSPSGRKFGSYYGYAE
ncbi:putative exopolysaccharide biosynthesis protein [Caenibius tardaugens NBRC 16725]|uniref:Putative exopolysaccharide biosynthesis protein n=1 Tax=Caenibius tardaugens NBRC 16725 TaxID=1219035 RepID=U2ZZN5_9SPHN|nr:AAA family ATPase [Caenibius tardaugens]AZI38011.1 capsular biosynthesis protein [Caenibius tardaugens NBRC 16725]GAD47988.1 putative exopolysaccharide biosynthesis protein [Caenibius tardaugens NBRC 16725]